MARVTENDAHARLEALPQGYADLAIFAAAGQTTTDLDQDFGTACSKAIDDAIQEGRLGQLCYEIERAELIRAVHSTA